MSERSLRRSGWLIGGNGIRLIISGSYFILLARLLGPAQLGWFAAILAGCNLASPFAFVGQPEWVVQWLSRRPQDVAWVWGNALLLGLIGGLGLSLGLLLPLAAWLPGVDLRTIGLLLFSEVLIFSLQEIQRGILVAQERIRDVAFLDTGMALARLAAAGLALGLGWRSLSEWAVIYSLMAGLVGGITAWWVRRIVGSGRVDLGQLKPMALTGWDFAVGLAATKTFTDLDKLLLPRLAIAGITPLQAAAITGYYSAAYRIINFAQTPVLALLTSSFAEICRQGEQGLQQGCRVGWRLAPWILGYGSAATLAMSVISGAIPWILGEQYRETATILRWLSLVILLEGIHALLSNLLAGAGRQRIRSWIQLAALGLNAGLNIWWIPIWGWRGAASATLLAEVSLVIALISLIAWLVRQEIPKVRL